GGTLMTPGSSAGTAVVAATLAFPLASAARSDILLAPLVAAYWAEAVGVSAYRGGAGVRVEPLVSADLVGLTVEAGRGDHDVLGALPEWFVAGPEVPSDNGLAALKQRCLSRLRSTERWSDAIRAALFGPEHRYGTGAAETTGRISGCGPDDLAAAARV